MCSTEIQQTIHRGTKLANFMKSGLVFILCLIYV